MAANTFLDPPRSILLLIGTVAAQQLPYNPTRIFLSPQNDRVAYILKPTSISNWQFSLSSLDLTSRITTASLSIRTLFSSLPFLDSIVPTSVTTILDSSGNLSVITGDCSLGNAGTRIWKMDTQERASDGNVSWNRQTLKHDTSGGLESVPGYLAAGFAFSRQVTGKNKGLSLYLFGGMCPTSNATDNTWLSDAQYSAKVLDYTPVNASNGSLTYEVAVDTGRSPPIAQAGHSLTPLGLAYTNRSDGTQLQQQAFVLLGGHTQTAFINMSQVALLSLPQETWTFLPVDQPYLSDRTDLTVRTGESHVDPRSGHSAVLSSDGKTIVVFGGWVGDLNTAASPQLAILNVGDGYGGEGSWSWTIPDTTGPGLPTGAGIYGHGATMLPGNVMLVFGGYTISPPSQFRERNLRSQSLNDRAYLYNLSSNTWLPEYTMPAIYFTQPQQSSGPLATSSQRAGLGAGLAIGAVAVVCLLVFYLWYKRRLRRRREAREREISALAMVAHRFGSDEWGLGGFHGWGASYVAAEHEFAGEDRQNPSLGTNQSPYGSARHNPSPQGWRRNASRHAERTGLLIEVPSPTRGLRKNVSAGRGPYPYEKRRRIHPILEREEENSQTDVDRHPGEQEQRSLLLTDVADNDPFSDEQSRMSSRPHSEAMTDTRDSRQQEVDAWVSDWEKAAEALMAASETVHADGTGRSSPAKSDRTTSTLSDYSSRTGGTPSQSGATGFGRTASTRSAKFLSSIANSLIGTREDPEELEKSTGLRITTRQRRNSSPSRSRPNTGNSIYAYDEILFAPAGTRSMQLQAEEEALLGLHRSHDPARRMTMERAATNGERKPVGWMGSMRRALGTAVGSAAAAPTTASGRSASLTAESTHYEQAPPSTSSPLKASKEVGQPAPCSVLPRRTASDGGFWRSKRGAKDWGVKEASQDNALRYQDGEDWDVEGAAENRVVQLMFTVPRQQLRVVNADADGGSLISIEEKDGTG